jgi:serine/threonine-protein kinase
MTEPADRLAAALADRYRIERALGEGGMATVYLAEDLKHDRKVALKVLKPELAAVLGAERFVQEIRTTANLQHPNILPLYDSGEAGTFLYYVMPYVEGDTLRSRLDREKQLGIEETVEIGRDVAAALQYAHERGIVHRDIKPENILFQGSQAVVADFGIALAVSHAGGARLTETGLSLGTPHYMSPEQAVGDRELDARSDIYSLGAVLYEMLAGEPPHSAGTAQAVISKIVMDEAVPVTQHRAATPPHVAATLRKALAKVPADRFPSARDVAEALARPGLVDTSGLESATPARPAWLRDWRSIAAIAVAIAGVVYGLLGRGPPAAPTRPVVRLTLGLPADQGLVPQYLPIAISRDGSRLAYVGVGGEYGTSRQLYSRPLGQRSATPLAGTEGGGTLFFSPDGAWLGFYVGSSIRKVPVAGGPVVTLVDSTRRSYASATWTDDGYVVFPSEGDALAQVPDVGGASEIIYRDTSYAVVQPISLGGAKILFARCRPEACAHSVELVVLDRSSGRISTVHEVPTPTQIAFAAPDLLLYLVDENDVEVLYAVPFDAARMEVTGKAVPLDEDVRNFAVAESGTLVIVRRPASVEAELTLVDRGGAARPLAEQRRDYLFPQFSPDGGRLAVEIHDASGGHIWVYDRDAGTLARLTSQGHNSRPVWSPDGSEIAYASSRDSLSGVYRMRSDGGGDEHAIGRGGTTTGFTDVSWSPDGRLIAYAGSGPSTPGRDLWVVATDPDSAGRPVVETPADETRPVFSPDGRWLAYTSDESGRREVYVRSFPGPGGRWLISTDGGDGPRWNPRGGEIFYLGTDGWMYAAALALGADVRVMGRERLFDARPYTFFTETSYGVAPSGRAFALIRSEGEDLSIEIAVNWGDEARSTVRPIR